MQVKPIAVTMGDPAGIGPEITVDAWGHSHESLPPFFVIGDPQVYAPLAIEMGLPPVMVISEPADALEVFANGLPILPLPLTNPAVPGQPDSDNAAPILQSIKMAVRLCAQGDVRGMVTNPISKIVLYDAGFSHAGHTEYLGELGRKYFPQADHPDPVMLLCGGGLRVALVTIHVALKDVPGQITRSRVEATARTLHRALQTDFAFDNPRMVMCGLNPHAGENGALGSEEHDLLLPLARDLRAQGITITDPQAADALFRADLRDNYDGVLAMYHDQALIPVKTLDFYGGTNVTLGLPFVRVSPDHGTGFDIAGHHTARSDSLVAALNMAASIADNRTRTNV